MGGMIGKLKGILRSSWQMTPAQFISAITIVLRDVFDDLLEIDAGQLLEVAISELPFHQAHNGPPALFVDTGIVQASFLPRVCRHFTPKTALKTAKKISGHKL